VSPRRTFWLAAAATAGAAWVLALGRSLFLTLPAAFAMGALGGLLILLVPAVLSDRHGRRRSTAFAESNAVSSAFGGVAPLLIGAAILAGLAWGPGFALPATLFLVALAAAFGPTRFPIGATAGVAEGLGSATPVAGAPVTAFPAAAAPVAGAPVAGAPVAAAPIAAARPRRGLGPEFWRHWLTLVIVVGVEFCMIYWAAGYLQAEVGLSPAAAAASVAVFLAGMVAGRVAGGRVALHAPPDRLLVRALGLAAAGFVVFWATGLPVPSVVGLAITGLGVAMLYPLALAMAVGVASDAPDLASARCALGSGLAITIAPLALGWSADVFGIRLAYLIVPALIGLAFLTVRYAHR
jgi:MFS family permease